jgi:hypothetical protein
LLCSRSSLSRSLPLSLSLSISSLSPLYLTHSLSLCESIFAADPT